MTSTTKPKQVTTDSSTVTFTLRNPPYSYFHLSIYKLPTLVSAQTQLQQLDEITARSYLSWALEQYLGLTGTAISIDILKVEGQDFWIRVSRDDETAVTAAVAQWAGARGVAMRIEARGSWLGGVIGRRKDEKLWTLES
jgi:ribonuclease P/MRP protein subunit POP8